MRQFGKVIIMMVWYLTVITWPFVRWVLALDCVLQMMLMLYRWNVPGAHPLLTFTAHFAVLVALTWFVSYYRPRSR